MMYSKEENMQRSGRPVKGGAIYKHTKLPFNYKNVCLERDY